MITSTATYYYHFDGLGSVVALSDANGNRVETYSYDVFGEPNSTSALGNPYLFTGRRYDSETALYYYRARYYNADIGRFLQTDPVGYVDGLNLYTYVGNNPLNWADPYGLCKGNGGGKPWYQNIQDYLQEVGTWPWNVAEEAFRIEEQEYGDYGDPFGGDYRHFVAAGILTRQFGMVPSCFMLQWNQREESDPWDAAAEWRGWLEAWRHPLTPLRQLGKDNTVRPIRPRRRR